MPRWRLWENRKLNNQIEASPSGNFPGFLPDILVYRVDHMLGSKFQGQVPPVLDRLDECQGGGAKPLDQLKGQQTDGAAA